MLSDIVHGKLDTADVFFLIAAVLAVLATVAYAVVAPPPRTLAGWAPALLSAAVAFASLAWLVL